MVPGDAAVSVWEVLQFTAPMCLMALLGTLPLLLQPRSRKSDTSNGKGVAWTGGLAIALSCGVMLSASYNLIMEGQPFGEAAVILALVAGTLLMRVSQAVLDKSTNVRFHGLTGAPARQAYLLVAAMVLHCACEGAGVGVSFAQEDGKQRGTLVALALGLHNTPECIGIGFCLLATGLPNTIAAQYAFLTTLAQPVMAALAFAFVGVFPTLLPYGMGLSAGSMLHLVLAELLPVGVEALGPQTAASAAIIAAALFEGLRMLLGWVVLNPDRSHEVVVALGWSLIAGLSTGIGGLLVASLRVVSQRVQGFLLGLAVGVMMCLSAVELIVPTFLRSNTLLALLALLCGALGVWGLDRCIGELDLGAQLLPTDSSPLGAGRSDAQRQKRRSALLTTLALAAHNAPEGLTVGVSSMGTPSQKTLLIVTAISMHNIPEGIAVAAAVLGATGSRTQAVVVSLCTGLVEPIAAVASVAFLSPFLTESLLDYVLLAVGAIMVSVSFQLMPEALANSAPAALTGAALGAALMLICVFVLED